MRVLAADIGGTKSWICLCESHEVNTEVGAKTEIKVIHEHVYAGADYNNFSSLLTHFLQTAEEAEDKESLKDIVSAVVNIDVMCLALAGVIEEGHCKLTNLDWELDSEALATDFNINKVIFVNDFQAAAMGVSTLNDDDFIVLNSAEAEQGGVTVVTGAGTGLGMAWMQGSEEQLQLFDTEGGHIDFAPTTNQQIALLQYLRRQHHHVSYERILSGDGLVQLYRFLTGNKNGVVTARKITEWTNQKVFVAEATMHLFIEIYAAYIGNLALLYKPSGGIYIAGGIAAHILPWMKGKEFKRSYLAKGRMHKVAARVPVYLVVNTRLGLQGAIQLAVRSIHDENHL